MAFQSRDEYEAWKRRATGQAATSSNVAASDARLRAEASPSTAAFADAPASPGDIELRLSPLYGALIVFVGLVFTVIGFVPFGKAGPTFHMICRVAGPAAILAGIVMLRRRKVIVRITSLALHIPGAVIPWIDIDNFQRVREARNYWIGINLKTRRTDLDGVAKKAQKVLHAMRSRCADFDYVILETDLPRSGLWFIDECQRRMAAAGGTTA